MRQNYVTVRLCIRACGRVVNAVCSDDGGCCCTCWRVLMWLDNWKKGVLYVALAVPTFIELNMLAVVCGR